jgi:cytoskeletal protein CcmA (bactofilin family)
MEELRNRIDLSQHTFSLLGKGDFFKGEIILHNDTFISSRFEGSIRMEGDCKLVIEPSASIIGKINAHSVELYGSVEGEIDVTEMIILYPSSIVKGRVKAQSIHIQPGAIINGDCHTLQ